MGVDVTRRSQTELAVLGALSMQPMTAYALRSAIKDVLGHFWSESFGQIYPTLTALQGQGLVEGHETGRRGSSTYSLTDTGRQQLRQLLAEPVTTTPPRNGLLLRLFFGRTLGVQACRDLLMAAKTDAQRRLSEYQALTEQVSVEDADSPDLPYTLITISAGSHNARATLQWATQALQSLEQLTPTADSPVPGPSRQAPKENR
jgi:DNA-binding PadR family transcriptional regulator